MPCLTSPSLPGLAPYHPLLAPVSRRDCSAQPAPQRHTALPTPQLCYTCCWSLSPSMFGGQNKVNVVGACALVER
ncbi:unnamed protein product [Urochloa humidicola]